MVRGCTGSPNGARTPPRPVVCWRLLRFTTAAHERMQPGSGASRSRSFGTGWLRFNKHGPEGLINGKAPGNRPKLNEEHRQALARMVESGPIPAVHGVVRWPRKDLARRLFEEFRIAVDETTVGRALRTLGFAKLSARPRHYAQNELEREAFKKACPLRWRRSEPGCPSAPR